MASNYLAKGLKRSALTVALGLCFAGGVQAQSTTGGISGTVPAGSTVTISNNSGLTRTLTADANGRYNAGNLPVGAYTVVSGDNKREVVVTVGSNTNVSFGGGDATTLGTVTVTGSTVNPIDITTTDTRSVLTAAQLERLPLARSAESVALLAPGVISGAAGYFGGLVSFGGSGVSENAYYINGYFSGEPLSNLGGFSLPYGSVEQQETFLGGYSAKYGRSAGGVINQIGKRGTNEFKFGGQVIYTPRNLRGNAEDLFLPNLDFSEANANPNLPSTCGDTGTEKCGWGYEDPAAAGTLYTRGKASESWNHSYSLYAGGPIIKDRLFFFASGEMYKSDSIAAPNSLGSRSTESQVEDPKLYAKIDWNISDNHFLELTYMGEKYQSEGQYYDYDFDTATRGALQSAVPTPVSQNTEYTIAKYTGYLTDTLTFSALYGHGRFTNRQVNPSILPGLPFISSASNQNPALNGGTTIPNKQGAYQATDALNYTDGIRADLEWIVGDHTLTFGVDNIKFKAENAGVDQVTDVWIYSRTNSPNSPISSTLGVGAPGSNYYVQKYIYESATSMSLDQKAWYLEDRWQVTDNLLLSLGIRNDKFTNKNNFGETYIDAKNQWAPRLGFAWDVNGDSSLKVFGNAGRYFLALPNNVAIRGASASTLTREYFTYTGIDANGAPTGLTPVPGLNGGPAPGPVSSNGEYGTSVDVLAFAPKDLKNMYQDEFILGFEKSLGESWMMGVKLTSRDLKSSVDDVCDPYTFADANDLTLVRPSGSGYLAQDADGNYKQLSYCYMFNPGGTNTFSVANADANGVLTGGRTEYVMTSQDWRFEDGLKRKYSGIDIYFERPFDGKWEARIDYTFSKSKGNNEGQVKSEFGQTNISKTQDWDVAEIMKYGYGYLANDRRHQLKARGSYQITPEWLVGANVRITSGAPISCLGLFNPDGSVDEGTGDADPVGYGASYHTCFGQIATPGSQRTPWTKTIDLGVTYRPAYFDDKLSLGLQIRNLTNENKALQVDVTSETDAPYTVSNTYLLPIGRQTPRTVVFTASYDW